MESPVKIKENGDIVNIDVTVIDDEVGMADTSQMFLVGNVALMQKDWLILPKIAFLQASI